MIPLLRKLALAIRARRRMAKAMQYWISADIGSGVVEIAQFGRKPIRITTRDEAECFVRIFRHH